MGAFPPRVDRPHRSVALFLASLSLVWACVVVRERLRPRKYARDGVREGRAAPQGNQPTAGAGSGAASRFGSSCHGEHGRNEEVSTVSR